MTPSLLSGKGPESVRLPTRCESLPRDSRGYPIIATVGRERDVVDFGSISEKRKLVLATFDLCAVCGAPFHAESRWQVVFTEDAASRSSATSNEAPVPEVCALYSAQVCPFVSSPYARFGDDMRRGARRPEAIYLVEYQRTEAVYGRRSGLQSETAVLHFDMSGQRSFLRLRTAGEARDAYERVLAADEEPALDASERAIRDLVNNSDPNNPTEDSGGVMAGAAWYAGAAYCPGVRKVQGMGLYADRPQYSSIARQIAMSSDAIERFGESKDAATRATMQWLRTRTELPRVLLQWRNRARHLTGADGSGSPSGAEATVRKARRKSAAASRRKNRRS